MAKVLRFHTISATNANAGKGNAGNWSAGAGTRGRGKCSRDVLQYRKVIREHYPRPRVPACVDAAWTCNAFVSVIASFAQMTL